MKWESKYQVRGGNWHNSLSQVFSNLKASESSEQFVQMGIAPHLDSVGPLKEKCIDENLQPLVCLTFGVFANNSVLFYFHNYFNPKYRNTILIGNKKVTDLISTLPQSAEKRIPDIKFSYLSSGIIHAMTSLQWCRTLSLLRAPLP